MTDGQLIQLSILDIDGVLEETVETGIDADRFEYNLHEDAAQAELEELEAAERVTGVHV
jgi:hypothetical protein